MAPKVLPERCRYPIVLVHGLFGFVERRLGPFRLVYFRGVAPYLESVGNRVIALSTPACRRIEDRAARIAETLDHHPDLKDTSVNLIAHSMGGLDGRYLISRLGYAERVRSLTTVATPHRGSVLADALMIPGLNRLSTRLVPALGDLTEKALRRFNAETPDQPVTRYFSVPAKTGILSCSPILWPTYLFLRAVRGPNDGQVTAASAQWGEVLEEVYADHIQLIGVRFGLNAFTCEGHLNLFGRITKRLVEAGC